MIKLFLLILLMFNSTQILAFLYKNQIDKRDSVLLDFGNGAGFVPIKWFKNNSCEYFCYNMLCSDTIAYKEIALEKDFEFKDEIFIEDSVRYKHHKLTCKTTEVLISFDIIEYSNYEDKIIAESKDIKFKPSYLNFDKNKYNLDSLYWGNEYGTSKIYNKSFPCNLYQHNLNGKKYIALFIFLFIYNSSTVQNKIILFDISDKSTIKVHSMFNYQTSSGPFCFGDFNNNGKIDYIHWNFSRPSNQDTAQIFELQNDQFVCIKENYLILNSLKRNDISSWKHFIYCVDINKSRWFNLYKFKI